MARNRPPRRLDPRVESAVAANRGRRPKRTPARGKPHADFHNPYNFIPAPPRNAGDPTLGDHPPVGHHRYEQDRYSGWIEATLTTETPLLLPDAARSTVTKERGQKHETFPIRLGPDRKPYLAPTSLKGMLRSAYEAVTNSRFGVFSGHDDRLGYRVRADDASSFIPARIEGDEIVLLTGTSGLGLNTPVYAAWLPSYEKDSMRSAYPTDWMTVAHRDCVWVEVKRKHYKRTTRRGKVIEFDYWKVVSSPCRSKPSSATLLKDALPKGVYRGWVKGWVCMTNKNIDNKHDERVFFTIDPNPPKKSLTDPLKAQWKALIKNYAATHEKERQQGLTGPPALRRSVWSRHIVNAASEETLKDGDLCYAKIDNRGNVIGLYPVNISRKIHDEAPSKFLDGSLKPAAKLDKLSPADRVFGWVNANGSGAYRGQLRVEWVECETRAEDAIATFEPNGVPLAILGEPKPQQVRFYLAKDKNGTPQDGGSLTQVGYNNPNTKGLRGRKVYPHHGGLPRGYWDNPTENRTQDSQGGRYQEYRRPINDEGIDRDNQNRSVTAWVKPKTTFRFRLRVWNLSAVELGALLWLLNLDKDHYHRLGGGKPLGFGSVRIELAAHQLRTGAQMKDDYVNAFGEDASKSDRQVDIGRLVGTFKDAVKEACLPQGQGTFESVSFIEAFLQAAKGFANLPIHYPRNTRKPNPEGENFKWFVENERPQNRRALPPLSKDDGLPRY